MVVNVAVLTAGGEGEAVGRKVECMDGSEVAVDLGQLLREYYAVESDLEATCALVCQSHISCVLTAADQAVELLPFLRVVQWAYGHSAARSRTEIVLAHFLKRLGVEQFGAAVSGGRKEHGEVMGHGQLVNLARVDLTVLDGGAGPHVDDQNAACLGANIECLVEGTPDGASEFM